MKNLYQRMQEISALQTATPFWVARIVRFFFQPLFGWITELEKEAYRDGLKEGEQDAIDDIVYLNSIKDEEEFVMSDERFSLLKPAIGWQSK